MTEPTASEWTAFFRRLDSHMVEQTELTGRMLSELVRIRGSVERHEEILKSLDTDPTLPPPANGDARGGMPSEYSAALATLREVRNR